MKYLPSRLGGALLIALAIAVPLYGQQPASAPASQPAEAPATQPAPAPTPAPAPPPAPTTNEASTFDAQRFAELLALIEGRNSLQARRTGARELLRLGWAETTPKLLAVLRNGDVVAKAAVAGAMADLPATITAEFIAPLTTMLADADTDARNAAAAALAAGPADLVLPALREIALDKAKPPLNRLAAVNTLGLMTKRPAVALLVEIMHGDEPQMRAAALAAIESSTARDFADDYDAAFAWWEVAQQIPAARWQEDQIDRLLQQHRSAQQAVQSLEQRLAAALRENYVRCPEPQRNALLDSYLTDPCAAVRQMALALVQASLTEGKTLPGDTISRARDLLADTTPAGRAAAVRTVAALRDAADEARLLEMLANEHHPDVRLALVNGLGYVGSSAAIDPILTVLGQSNVGLASEAVTALGRLAERGTLTDAQLHERATAALLARYQATPADQFALRERLLWAMSRIGNPRFGALFVAALSAHERPEVRLAAVRGISGLADPRVKRANASTQPANTEGVLTPGALVDALLPATKDADAVVRRAAVEALAGFGTTDQHVQALWDRLAPEAEAEENIRVTAWRGATRILATRPLDVIDAWLARLPGDEATKRQHQIELLQAAEGQLNGTTDRRDVLGTIRARLAAIRAQAGQIDDALALYVLAIDDLHAAGAPSLPQTAVDLLRLALSAGRYDATLAAALASENPGLDPAALWDGVAPHIEAAITPERVDEALRMLTQLKANPPGVLPADRQQTLDQMLAKAQQTQRDADAARVTTALQALAANAEDEGARNAITQLTGRALPHLRAALLAALQAETPDAALVQRLHDLVKAISPEWAGFAPDASVDDKRKAAETLPG